MSTDSPASPAASRLDTSGEGDREGLGSPCLDLDELSSSDDDIGILGGLSDLLVTLLCDDEEVFSPVNSDQALSDVDFPPELLHELPDFVPRTRRRPLLFRPRVRPLLPVEKSMFTRVRRGLGRFRGWVRHLLRLEIRCRPWYSLLRGGRCLLFWSRGGWCASRPLVCSPGLCHSIFFVDVVRPVGHSFFSDGGLGGCR